MPTEVELLRVERKRTSKSASPLAKRDMATNLGGFWLGCYICESRPPKLVAISHRRVAPRFCIGSSPRAAHSLNKTSTSVGGRTHRPSLRMTNRGFVSQYVLEKNGRFVNRPYDKFQYCFVGTGVLDGPKQTSFCTLYPNR